MKNVKNLLFALLGVISIGFITTSCNDKFSEKDLLELQVQLGNEQDSLDAVRQLAALDQAGNFLDYTVNLNSDNTPIAGVDVSITNQSGGAITVQSDANGNAVFTDLQLGGHTVAISSADYFDVSYLLDFGTPIQNVHYRVVNNNIIPIKTSEASKIELFGLTGLETATIIGRVEIETDLTNDVPEIPQNITVRANLDAYSSFQEHTERTNSGGYITGSIYIAGSFTFNQGDIGSAAVDNATGNYSMTVPATNGGGVDVQLLMPFVETNQTLGFSMVNNVDVGAQVGTQLTRFVNGTTASTTPTVSGVLAVFSAPAAEGAGFTVGSFAPFPRSFGGTTINTAPVDISDDRKVRWTSGAGYQFQPDVTVTGGSATTDATIEPLMEWQGESIALNNGGAGYAVNDVITIDVVRKPDNTTMIVGAITFTVDAVASGVITDGTLSTLSGQFWDAAFTSGNYDLTSIAAEETGVVPAGGTGATFTLTYGGVVTGHDITNTGDDYTSNPTLAISGGSPGTAATIALEMMAFQYSYNVDNSGTSAYVLVPDELAFTGVNINGNNTKSTQALYVNTSGNAAGTVANANSFLRVVSGGNVEFNTDANLGLQSGLTSTLYTAAPTPLVTNATHTQAEATVDVNVDGEVTALTVTDNGTGYTSAVSLTLQVLTGLPGAGASITLTGFATNTSNLEVAWAGLHTVVSMGSDYTTDVNIGSSNAPANPTVTVLNGDTFVQDYNYGTGVTVEDVQ